MSLRPTSESRARTSCGRRKRQSGSGRCRGLETDAFLPCSLCIVRFAMYSIALSLSSLSLHVLYEFSLVDLVCWRERKNRNASRRVPALLVCPAGSEKALHSMEGKLRELVIEGELGDGRLATTTEKKTLARPGREQTTRERTRDAKKGMRGESEGRGEA